MPNYPGIDNERRVDSYRLQQLVTSIFGACGMRETDADLLSQMLVNADLRGCHSHGVIRVPDYVEKLQNNGVNPTGKPFVLKDNQGALVIEGGNSMGQIACTFAMDQAIERARSNALAMAVVQGSNHCGALADYSIMAMDQGMIGIAGSNALPTMAPYGGIDKILGINPISIAIPAGEEHSIVYDAAFSASSHGKIRVFHQKEAAIPIDWAFDTHGQPTTDAAHALEGLLQPIGGYKGTGLALIVGLLSTMLSNAGYGTDLGNMVDGPKAGQDGQFCMAINISSFIKLGDFKRKLDKVIRQIKDGKRAPGFDEIYPPGGWEALLENDYRKSGIPLNNVTVSDLKNTAVGLGITPKF